MKFNAIVDIVFIFLFGYFISVQCNDVDAIKWIFIYGLVMVLPVLHLIHKLNSSFSGIVNLVILTILVVNFTSLTDWINAGFPDFIDYKPTEISIVEGIREFLGLVICQITAVYYHYKIKKERG